MLRASSNQNGEHEGQTWFAKAATVKYDLPRLSSALITTQVQEETALVLGFAPASALDDQLNIWELGFDSLTSLDLRIRLERRFSIRLPPTFFIDYPTTQAMAAEIFRRLSSTAITGGPVALAHQIEPQLNLLANAPDVRLYDELLPQMDGLTRAYVLQALQQLGWKMIAGERVTIDAVAARLQIVPRHRRLLACFLDILVEDGILQAIDSAWSVVRPPEAFDDSAQVSARLLSKFPFAHAELTLLDHCGRDLASALRGLIEPWRFVLTRHGQAAIERLYRDSPPNRVLNGLAQEAVSTLLAERAADRQLSVLEVGAGTGATTASVLPLLDAAHTEYVFSDVSPWFLEQAKQRFHEYSCVSYRPLDIERDPHTQGFSRHAYDIVIAAHVLHATRDLRSTLRHVADLLAPHGLLIVTELTKPERWLDVVFGLTDGWWRFTDGDVRPNGPLAPLDTWLQLLTTGQGFAEAASVPALETAHRYLSGRGALLLAMRCG